MEETITLGASKQAISHHYDLSNDFYKLWLDANMLYSSALWEGCDHLEDAQINKLDHHIKQSKADKAKNVIDVGCGWGALIERLDKKYEVNNIIGLTLSEAQAEWIRYKNNPKLNVLVEAWNDHRPDKPYDAMISIGAFEHFARLEDTDEQKQANYRKFFEWAHSCLEQGSYLSLQSFAYSGKKSREEIKKSKGTQFLSNEIFKETDPPSLLDIVVSSRGLFEIVNLRNDRLDYSKTCKLWHKRLKEKQVEAIGIVGETTYKNYLDYLMCSYLGFETGLLDLYRITFKRI
jgi:cyclopropane-fatty-acyl-phospholipid synthase